MHLQCIEFLIILSGYIMTTFVFHFFFVPLDIDASNGPLPSDGVLGHGERGNHAFLHPEEFRIIH